MTLWCENEVSEKSKHSSWTVGHVSRRGNLTPPTIIIYKETIGFNDNSDTNDNDNDNDNDSDSDSGNDNDNDNGNDNNNNNKRK